ncbi:Zinc finger CCCH domain-containing protein 53 [Ananas comosus]|uniref:Zinc finger CCCH domain-containing protein 53 n=1 Tax=Ananas comosus TaxID=4615 RepID=A0A199UQM1_ANACO|nr:Zinc finger CCCH domain-containing protein 53 [Ananas comosus]
MLYGANSCQEVLLRRKLEEQQQAAELQQAIELQGRRFMGLQLLDLKARTHLTPTTIPSPTINPASASAAAAAAAAEGKSNGGGGEATSPAFCFLVQTMCSSLEHNLPDSPFASPTKASSSSSSSSFLLGDSSSFSSAIMLPVESPQSNSTSSFMASNLLPPTSTLDLASSYNSCFFQMPRNGQQCREKNKERKKV